MAAQNRIVVATSLPPKMSRRSAGKDVSDGYQRLCLQSWLDCGFRVLSVNNPDEIGDLAARYPEVEFVPVERNASAISGRKTPFIADIFQALLATSEPHVGIINADIVFEPGSAWQSEVPAMLGTSLVTAQRYDTTSLSEGVFRRFYPGFDYFFFDRAFAAEIADHAGPFAMGLPWWDIWLLTAAILREREIRILERPGIAHLIHGQGYQDAMLRLFAIAFAEFVARNAGRGTTPIPAILSKVVRWCRELASLTDRKDVTPAMDQAIVNRFSQEMTLWRNELLGYSLRLMPDETAGSSPIGELAPLTVFHRVEERLAAGISLEAAKYHDGAGNADEAARLFQDALGKTPNDGDVLAGFGEHLCRRGQVEDAAQLLGRAAMQEPDAPSFWNHFGFALRATNRREDAIASFERALSRAPQFRDVYYNLAVTLYEVQRAADAIDVLHEAKRRWPGDAEFDKLHRHFSRSLIRS